MVIAPFFLGRGDFHFCSLSATLNRSEEGLKLGSAAVPAASFQHAVEVKPYPSAPPRLECICKALLLLAVSRYGLRACSHS